MSVIASLLFTELVARYYFYRWNNNLSVPFLMFSRSYPQSDKLRDFIQPSKTQGIIFELKPNIRSAYLDKPFITNSKGFLNSKEFTPIKPPKTIRIIGIGDSVMTSWGVNPDETYLAQLELKLNQALTPINIEIINMAVPGYNTAIEYEVIKSKALKHNPDLIILGYVGNDMDLPNYIRRKIITHSYGYYIVKTSIEMILNNQIPDKQLHLDSQLWSLSNSPYDEINGTYGSNETPSEYKYMIGEKNFFQTVEKIAELTKSRNIPLILLDTPPELKQKKGLRVLDLYALVHRFIEENNIPLSEITISSEDQHYNARGHKLYADYLFNYLMYESEEFRNIADKYSKRPD